MPDLWSLHHDQRVQASSELVSNNVRASPRTNEARFSVSAKVPSLASAGRPVEEFLDEPEPRVITCESTSARHLFEDDSSAFVPDAMVPQYCGGDQCRPALGSYDSAEACCYYPSGARRELYARISPARPERRSPCCQLHSPTPLCTRT